MKILVTGGAGYIGSHTSVELLNHGIEVVILDNLMNSKVGVIDKIEEITRKKPIFYKGDVRDVSLLRSIFQSHKIDAVIHFASLKAVGESVKEPLVYYQNNLDATLCLLQVMSEYGVKRIIFSSSATVYGEGAEVPIKESAPLGKSTNPYGASKQMIEQILSDVYVADSTMSIIILRYFNPIGAHSSGLIGDDPEGEANNLMPYILRVASGEKPYLSVFGNDYDTPDGTGVRDYIHVVDLAIGHVKALSKAMKENGIFVYNLGTGKGYSVLELVKSFEEENGVSIPYQIKSRRDGDVSMCYADVTKAQEELGFTAKLGIQEMVRDSYNFYLKNKKN